MIGQLTIIIAAFLLVMGVAGFICWRLRRLLMPESMYRVESDNESITVIHPGGERSVVHWDKLTKVTIRTTDGGPWELDLFWSFHEDAFGPAAVFPGGTPGGQKVIESLDKRLAGFSAQKVNEAMCSQDNALFVVWEAGAKQASESRNVAARGWMRRAY